MRERSVAPMKMAQTRVGSEAAKTGSIPALEHIFGMIGVRDGDRVGNAHGDYASPSFSF